MTPWWQPWVPLLGSVLIGLLALYGVIWTNRRADERERNKHIREMVMERASAVLDTANQAIGALNGCHSWSAKAAPTEYVKVVNLEGELAMRIGSLSLVTEELTEPADALHKSFEPVLVYLHAQIGERESGATQDFHYLSDLESRMMRVSQRSAQFTVAARRLIRETGVPRRRVRRAVTRRYNVLVGRGQALVRRAWSRATSSEE